MNNPGYHFFELNFEVMEDNVVPNLRFWLIRCSWLAGILMLAAAVFGGLWSGLAGLGDAAGARICQGVFWGAVVCWSANASAIVGLLTLRVLTENPETNDNQGIPQFPPPTI